MPCPHCRSSRTQEQPKRTTLGYRTSRCAACRRRFNERSGTPFNDLSVPTDIVFLVVLWRLRYPLSPRQLAEMFLERGFVFSHETVRAWEAAAIYGLTNGQWRPSLLDLGGTFTGADFALQPTAGYLPYPDRAVTFVP
jgi:hypothetical protein